VAREYVRLNVVTHEIGHQLKTRNGKGTGEDRL
jgi:Mlc titration factor MtfA (ptsG expression regulator)